MVTETRRQRLPLEQRRAVIIEAAGRLFGELGYDATRLDDVASEAGVTKPILYRHFDSKQALYLALLERHRDDLATFPGLISAEGESEQRLRAVLEAWFGYVEAHSYAWRMLFRDTGGGPEIAAFRLDVHARARAVLAGMIGALSEVPIPRREVEPIAELMSMGMGSLVLWWIENPTAPREAIIDAMTRIWSGILVAKP
jgi:AcrR family transcriptional regulator